MWVPPITSSFWITEAITSWITDDGFEAAVDRARDYQGQSPTYFALAWLVRQLFGGGEIALRMPSLLVLVLGTLLLFRLAKRLFDDDVPMIVIATFASMQTVAFAAVDARPYAFATTALIASTLFLCRFVDQHRRWDGVLYAFFTALTIYLHFLYAFAFVGHALYLYRHRSSLGTRALAGVIAGTGLLIAPLVPLVFDLLERRAALSVPRFDLVPAFLAALAPPLLIVAIGAGALAARAIGRLDVQPASARDGGLLLVIGSFLGPPSALFIISLFSDTSVFQDRYLLAAAPGLASFTGWLIGWLRPARARAVVVTALILAGLLVFGGRTHGHDGWREAAIRVGELVDDPATPVLLQGGLVESGQRDWLEDPERAQYLMAPLSPYPMEGEPIPLPYVMTDVAESYLEDLVAERLDDEDMFVVVMRYPFVPFVLWLEARLKPAGFRHSFDGGFGQIEVHTFHRPSGDADA